MASKRLSTCLLLFLVFSHIFCIIKKDPCPGLIEEPTLKRDTLLFQPSEAKLEDPVSTEAKCRSLPNTAKWDGVHVGPKNTNDFQSQTKSFIVSSKTQASSSIPEYLRDKDSDPVSKDTVPFANKGFRSDQVDEYGLPDTLDDVFEYSTSILRPPSFPDRQISAGEVVQGPHDSNKASDDAFLSPKGFQYAYTDGAQRKLQRSQQSHSYFSQSSPPFHSESFNPFEGMNFIPKQHVVHQNQPKHAISMKPHSQKGYGSHAGTNPLAAPYFPQHLHMPYGDLFKVVKLTENFTMKNEWDTIMSIPTTITRSSSAIQKHLDQFFPDFESKLKGIMGPQLLSEGQNRIPLKALVVYTVWATKQQQRLGKISQQLQNWKSGVTALSTLDALLEYALVWMKNRSRIQFFLKAKDKKGFNTKDHFDHLGKSTFTTNQQDVGLNLSCETKNMENFSDSKREDCYNAFCHVDAFWEFYTGIPNDVFGKALEDNKKVSVKFEEQEKATEEAVNAVLKSQEIQHSPGMEFSIYVVWATKQKCKSKQIVENLLHWKSQTPGSLFRHVVDYAVEWIDIRNRDIRAKGYKLGRQFAHSDLSSFYTLSQNGRGIEQCASVSQNVGEKIVVPTREECYKQFSQNLPEELWFNNTGFYNYLSQKYGEFERKAKIAMSQHVLEKDGDEPNLEVFTIYIVWATKQASNLSQITQNLKKWQSEAREGSPLKILLAYGMDWIKEKSTAQAARKMSRRLQETV
ncbi:hypothetical protein CROQUDRAFT_134510 [Cronartium quercuum f. sp. fusiforme G11]|uniref:Uncharacterized protein n=1 Tax=Cronartium quercuum f. sp. fusiforme G11 TaxID=708437 RepID=A0A9P6NHE1_9BASI|nr:hypothetical protein CROQUDRAFT_134510 [Cronartium quercuum f. sp. fusiforme G11]